MAHKIVWSLQARDDLREIVSFIAADNPTAAETFGYRLMSQVDPLANFPQLGRVVPEEGDENIREIILRPYRIIYQVLPAQQVVAIARLWHGARGEPEVPTRLEF
ncbi:MAG: type II toxin-antitoxin system RelE/ParE family toxin [Verrucomicrobia bacterium]|nr:type II toxin-antitoxin system RelE/ParE family toxin [Verrucomicrobiota bacterium]